MRARLAGSLVAALPLLAAACGDGPGDAAGDAPRAAAPPSGPWVPAELVDALPEEGPDLVDEAEERGLRYRNVSGEPGKPLVLEANGPGVALLDLGGDGDLDLVFSQGLASLAVLLEGPGADLEVFVNDGEGRFSRAEGPGLSGWWTGLAAGDVDGDGRADLVAAAYGDLALLLQDGKGRLVPFADAGLLPKDAVESGARLVPGAPREAGAAPWWATSLALLDADRDGALDLYVGQYLELDPLDPPRGELGEGALAVPCWWKGIPVFCGPRGLEPQPDRLLRGEGDGRFADVTGAWLEGHEPGFTLAVGIFDADMDGDTDVYVANDSTANLMLVNEIAADGSGRFADRALSSGVAVSPDGVAEAGMGVATGDVDRDGLLDLAVTNFSDEPTQLYLGAARGFANETYRSGLASESRRLLSWSAHFVDFDGDGRLELLTTNGHVYPQADEPGTGTRYGQPDTLWRILPGGGDGVRVERVWPRARRSVLAPELGTRGAAVGDVDGDLAPDVVLARIDGPAALGMNRMGQGARRVAVRLEGDPFSPGPEGRRSPRDATGAKVVLVPAFPDATPASREFALLAEVGTAAGYQSASSPWVHFGLGELEGWRELTVLWPSGRVEELGPGRAGARIVVREGEGVVSREEVRP